MRPTQATNPFNYTTSNMHASKYTYTYTNTQYNLQIQFNNVICASPIQVGLQDRLLHHYTTTEPITTSHVIIAPHTAAYRTPNSVRTPLQAMTHHHRPLLQTQIGRCVTPSPITHHPSPITHHPSPITHHSEISQILVSGPPRPKSCFRDIPAVIIPWFITSDHRNNPNYRLITLISLMNNPDTPNTLITRGYLS